MKECVRAFALASLLVHSVAAFASFASVGLFPQVGVSSNPALPTKSCAPRLRGGSATTMSTERPTTVVEPATKL